MSRMQLLMSKRNENAKRLNTNEDNLLQLEKERFEKEHNKQMKSIFQEKQVAKEAMSDIRRHRAHALLTARMVSQENELNSHADISPTLFRKAFCEVKRSQSSNKMVQGLEAHDKKPNVGEPCMANSGKKSPNHDNIALDFNCNATALPSRSVGFGRSRARAQTFSEGTTKSKIKQSLENSESTRPTRKHFLPSPTQKTPNGNVKSSGYLSVPPLPSRNGHHEQLRARARTFTEGTTKADLEDGSSKESKPLDPITFSKNAKLINQSWEQQEKSAVKSTPFVLLKESVVEDNRPRSRSDGSETDGFRISSRAQVPLSLSPQMKRRASSSDTGKLLLKRNSLQLPCVPLTQPPKRELSPSRGIAKFRQTGTAASAAQTLVSRYQREKSIAKATEHLIAERQKKERLRQEHQQMKKEWSQAGRTRTTGLKGRFFTIAQLVMALNALRKTASRRSSFADKYNA